MPSVHEKLTRTLATTCFRAAAAISLCVCAARAGADAIDDYIRTEMANQRIPGLALAIIRDGRPADVRSYGVANVETRDPVTPDTVFRIASVTKPFIATGIMLLVRDGKIALDDPVSKYIGDAPASWKGITIRHLLAHTAGLRRESPAFEPSQDKPVIELIRAAYGAPLVAKPGDQHVYSNLGYYALAEIIGRASGSHWSDFLRARVFVPLAMTATSETTAADGGARRASGYVRRDDVLREAPALRASRPSGGLLSSLADLVKWDAALKTHELLSSDAQAQMWTPAKLASGAPTSYGLGFRIDAVVGHKRIRHGGDNPGFRAEYTRFPDDGLSVIVLGNGDSLRPDAVAIELADRYIPGLSPQRKPIALDAAALGTYAGRYALAPDNVLTIAVDGDGLSVQSSAGGAQYKMVPDSRDSFFISQDETYLFNVFRGVAVELVIRSGPQELRAKRVP
jgi:D-alanyl-D-alanine carboxypeptidase